MKLKYWFVILSIIFVAITINSASASLLTNNAVYYTMDNADVTGGVVHDKSVQENNLTLTNALSGQQGKILQSIYCDGVGDKAETDAPFFSGTGNWTMSFWVNSTAGETTLFDNANAVGNNRIQSW